MQSILPLASSDVELQHIVDKYEQGKKDEDWIPLLKSEGNWLVITSDAGKKSKVGQKLPDLCAEHKITHIILGNKLHNRPSSDKLTWIAAGWKLVEDCFSKPPGSRFKLRLKEGQGDSLTIALEPVKIVTIAERIAARLAKRAKWEAEHNQSSE